MKTRHYIREETDTFDEVNKVLNELRDEIVDDSDATDRIVAEQSSRISKLEKKIEELTPESPTETIKPKKQPSAKRKKK